MKCVHNLLPLQGDCLQVHSHIHLHEFANFLWENRKRINKTGSLINTIIYNNIKMHLLLVEISIDNANKYCAEIVLLLFLK